jgi:hypothetical protein
VRGKKHLSGKLGQPFGWDLMLSMSVGKLEAALIFLVFFFTDDPNSTPTAVNFYCKLLLLISAAMKAIPISQMSQQHRLRQDNANIEVSQIF